MARKVLLKKRNNDMDMRAPVHATSAESVPDPRVYDIADASPIVVPSPRPHGRIRTSFIFLCLLTLAMLFATGYFYNQLSTLRQDSPALREEKTQEVVAKVSRLIDVPKGETPVLVTITDTTDLKDQPFFKNVQSGNIVLFYAVARKAYLYDPDNDIIVEVATLGSDSSIQ